MPSSEFSPNAVWASATPVGVEEELTTPSGQTCRAKRMSIEMMIAEGLLAEADSLTALVSKHTRKIKGAKGKADGSEVNTQSLMRDGAAVSQVIGLVDKLLPRILVSPMVLLHYSEQTVGSTKVTKMLSPEDRIEIVKEHPGKTVVFTDQVGLEDKMWLFDWSVGGLGSMSLFRQ